MNFKKQTMNYMILGLSALAMTACGGGGSSSSCLSNVTDSDGDGFYDEIDSAPNDASIPGDFSTPEKILANPEVKRVLKLAKDNGVNVRTELGNNPPNLTGYYRKEDGEGRRVITDKGLIGIPLFGDESRVCTANNRYESAISMFGLSYGSVGATTTKNNMLRGNKNSYTIYQPIKPYVCGNTKIFSMLIISGKINSNGDRVDEEVIRSTVYPSAETLTPDCNRWSVSHRDTSNKINDLDDLEYMCVDGNKAYTPEETWKNSDKESCKCTEDIEIECS